jgi:penicillin-binding protein 1A
MATHRSRRSRLVRFLVAVAALGSVAGVAGAVVFYLTFLADLPDLHSIRDYRPPLATVVLDRKGRPIGEFYVERRRLTPFEKVPAHVVQAFVSGEDSTFFEHEGIDYHSILRAAWVNLRAGGEIKQGGSTITQQMVKSLLLSPERKYKRKIKEMILARRIEQRFSKQEILYLYLNQIYFGHGAWGIGEAARTYFGKDVEDLNVSEAAQLAGLPKAPSRYSPFENPEAAESRRRYVLGRMLEDGYIDKATYDDALAHPPRLADESRRDRDYAAAAYFTEEVRRYLFDTLGGDAVLKGGLVVETTLDLDLQKAAVHAVREGLHDLDHRQGYRGPLRHVAADAVGAELERLAADNGIEKRRSQLAVAARDGGPPLPTDPVALARALLPDEDPAVGIVTAVDTKAQRARVGFAPGIEGVVRLEDVRWARPADPSVAPQPVQHIERVLHVGDVASFRMLPEAAAQGGDGDEPEADQGALLVALYQKPIVQGALLSFEVATGNVLALVGGYDYAESQFDRVTQARRQPGSAFKPMIYGAALSLTDDQGHRLYTPASIIRDRPTVYTDTTTGFVWRPKNYGRKFYGPITLRKALAKSVNNAAVHLCDEVGVDKVIRYARRLGIRSPLERSLALALGTSGVSLLEITRAYATFPAGGRRVVPRFIHRVLDADGNVLLKDVPLGDPLGDADAANQGAADQAPETQAAADAGDGSGAPAADADQLIAPEDAYIMADMLKAVVTEGTGWRLKQLGRPVAGKTGTTNDQADAWFVGFSPDVATGVWVGHDETRFLGWGETGSRAASPIWVDYMRQALAPWPRRDFDLPGSIVFARIDRETGLLATSNTKDSVFQAFISGTEPTQTAESQRTNRDAMQDLREDAFSSDPAMHLMKLDPPASDSARP